MRARSCRRARVMAEGLPGTFSACTTVTIGSPMQTACTPSRLSSTGCLAGATWASNLLQWTNPCRKECRGRMDERSFYTEKEETRKIKLVCPSCRGQFEAGGGWKVGRKKRELPRGAGEEDRRKFAKAASYMVRLDDLVACYKCRKRFELTGQSTVLINDNLGDPNADPENFGNR